MIITDREGCSGSWLTELLLLGTAQGHAEFRQDRSNGEINVSANHLHGDGHDDASLRAMHSQYQQQQIVRCHSTNYNLLRQLWPNELIIRIVPKTSIFQAIAAAYYKTRVSTDTSISAAFEFIRSYYHAFRNDPVPKLENACVVDFGVLSRQRAFERLCRELFELELHSNHWQFWRDYWMLQYYPMDEERLVPNINLLQLYRISDRAPTAFNLACFVFVYELFNDLVEEARLFSIDSHISGFPELIKIMQYR